MEVKINRSWVWPLIAITLLIALVLLWKFRPEAPSVDYTSQKTIDYLRTQVKGYKIRESYLSSQAELAYQRGIDAQKSKVIIRTVFKQDVEANERLRKQVKDSIIKAVFAVDPTMDSSIFSSSVATGILNMRSENKALQSIVEVDSVTIGELKVAYHAKDSACMACLDALRIQESLTGHAENDFATAKERAKKQARLKWIGFGGMAGGAFGPVGVPIGAGVGWIVGRFVKN